MAETPNITVKVTTDRMHRHPLGVTVYVDDEPVAAHLEFLVEDHEEPQPIDPEVEQALRAVVTSEELGQALGVSMASGLVQGIESVSAHLVDDDGNTTELELPEGPSKPHREVKAKLTDSEGREIV